MIRLAQHTVVLTVVFEWYLEKGHKSKIHVMLPPKQLSLSSRPLKKDSSLGVPLRLMALPLTLVVILNCGRPQI